MALTSFDLAGGPFTVRRASLDDVPAIIRLLAADQLGAHRESIAPENRGDYVDAFAAIDRDPAQLLLVVDGQARRSSLRRS